MGMMFFADMFQLEVLSGFIVMFCRIWTQPSSKGHQDIDMEEYVILMPWFGLLKIFAVLNAMLCIKPSWQKYTSLMIVMHVLGLLYGFGVMARHVNLVSNIMSLEAYSARWEHSIEYLIRPFWAITFDATNLLLFTGRLCAAGSWKQMDYVYVTCVLIRSICSC